MDNSKPASPGASHPFRWFPEFLGVLHKRSQAQSRLLGAALLVGIVAGLGAVAFAALGELVVRYTLDGIAGYRSQGPTAEARMPWLDRSDQPLQPLLLLAVPVLGGLLSGWLVFTFAPEAEGHGTDSVIDAYHNRQGLIRGRVPLIKMLASALTIGSGGSGGREGPIAQIGAGFGSVLAGWLRMRPVDRRILLAAGMGAGIAAIFRAPLAGALFAAEVLYRSPEFEPEVIMPAGLASVTAYSTFGIFFGWRPLFNTPELYFEDVRQLIPYTLLALAMVVLALIYTRTFYGITHLFHRLNMPRVLKPAVGALITGVIGVSLLQLVGRDGLSVMSFGYGILQKNLTSNEVGMSALLQKSLTDEAGMAALVLLGVALGKILTTSFTIGSGGSGGVFGPSMVVGGCAGGALGILFHLWWPVLVPDPASFMIVGMAGFFAAAAKTPFSTLLMVCELTGDYRLVVPALWVCTISFLLSDEQSLYQSQVEGRSYSPAHQGDYVRAVLAGDTVGQLLAVAPQTEPLKPGDHLATIIDRFDAGDCEVLPVVDSDGGLAGVIHLHELYWTANRRDAMPWILATDLLRGVQPLTPDNPLERATELFVANDLSELPVVSAEDGKKFLGMVSRTEVARVYLRRVHGDAAVPPEAKG